MSDGEGTQMRERDGYIPGVPCWVDTQQPDPAKAAEFYGGLFGWELEDVMPEGSDAKYFIGRIRGGDVAGVGSIPEGAPEMAMWNTYVWVDSADESAKKVTDAGGKIVMEPFDVMESGRMAVCSDPEGTVFCVWQAKEHKGAQVVNEHGSLNFNTLNTRDAEAAKPFYEAVFGWDVLPLPAGAMWTLPRYGEYLDREVQPGILEGMKEMDAPQGFEDVVASIQPIGNDQPDTPAHWSVTFAVDDADAIAKKATELGGDVLVEPTDVPWTKITVIKDPQGATFIASQFKPENRDLQPEGAEASA